MKQDMDINEFHTLIDAYLSGTLTNDNRQRFQQYLEDPAYQPALESVLKEALHTDRFTMPLDPAYTEQLIVKLSQQIQQLAPVQTLPHSIKTTWKRWAAAAILILAIGSGVYYLNNQSYQSSKSHKSQFRQEPQADISAGTNRAILTLSDGTQKQLSLADNGLQLQSDAVLLTTPNGGQYQAVLPDGSKIWLNVASSIKFPSAFSKNERRVEITGEVYFEVAKNSKRPFVVNVDNRALIEVLGTSFNVNSYNNEKTLNATLLEGSVRVRKGKEAVVIQPGEQAQLNGSIKIEKNVDIEKIMAWKNGLFVLEGVTLEEMMRQLERWYDIEVVYEKSIPRIELVGKITRSISLNGLLAGFKELGMHYKLEGKKLIIMNE